MKFLKHLRRIPGFVSMGWKYLRRNSYNGLLGNTSHWNSVERPWVDHQDKILESASNWEKFFIKVNEFYAVLPIYILYWRGIRSQEGGMEGRELQQVNHLQVQCSFFSFPIFIQHLWHNTTKTPSYIRESHDLIPNRIFE